MLSKSAQYRRLLKMYGGGSAGAALVVGPEGAARGAQRGGRGEGKGKGEAMEGVANDSCQMCQFVVQYIKIALASNETMAQVRRVCVGGRAGGPHAGCGRARCACCVPTQRNAQPTSM